MTHLRQLGTEGDEMAGSVVNLDAMIRREDMVSPPADFRGSLVERITITHLDDDFFSSMLRKPDFQRETAHWSPEKVTELIRAFVTGDLIPAVILWRRGPYVFVIDGAHRLSALIAWIRDDYGAGKWSLEHFGGRVPEEQQRIHDRTRKLVNTTVGPYAQLSGAKRNPANAAPDILNMLGNLAANGIVAQWVPQVDEKAAEASFFKINQQATPIDPTERQILRSRRAPNAIAARAIVRGATGHEYWARFSDGVRQEIAGTAKKIHSALYEPPLGQPVKTLDVPVAGRGYSALPFIYELVNWANDVPEVSKKKTDELEWVDEDGRDTIKFLKEVERIVTLITGNNPRSLGLHPIVYFYTRGGEFQPAIFIATAAFFKSLSDRDLLAQFTKVRAEMERFLVDHKEFVTLIVKKTGGRAKSHGRTVRYLEKIMKEFSAGKTKEEVLEALSKDEEFSFLIALTATPAIRDGDNPSRRFNRSTKSASYIDLAVHSAVSCGICGGLVHMNAMQIDHKEEASKGGRTDMSNAQVAHPYCNSAKAAMGALRASTSSLIPR